MLYRPLLLGALILSCLHSTAGHAQIPVPKPQNSTPTQQSDTAPPVVQTPNRVAVDDLSVDDENKTYTHDNSRTSMRYPPDQEATIQRKREDDRAFEKAAGGFEWVSFKTVGKSTLAFLETQKADIAQLKRDAAYIDIAISDVDEDGAPDVLLSHWDSLSCGVAGCHFAAYFGGNRRKPLFFKAERIAPIRKGIILDQNYYGF